MITKYQYWTGHGVSAPRVEAVQVIRETEKCVFIESDKGESRRSKKDYFDSFEDAKKAMIVALQKKEAGLLRVIEGAKERIETNKTMLSQAVALEENREEEGR